MRGSRSCHSERSEESLNLFQKCSHSREILRRFTPQDDKQGGGFTLVEILVVIAIVAIIGTIMAAVFINTLRGSNKSQILGSIKQNGQAVLENMDKTIRNSDDLICPTSGWSNTIVLLKNGVYTRYRIALPTDGTYTAPASCIGSGKNGCIVQDNPEKQLDPATGQEETDPAFIRRVCFPSNPIISGTNILTDTDAQSGVSIYSGFFNSSNLPGYKAAVTINFILKPGVGVPTIIAGQIDPVTFQTTVQLR